MAVPVKLKKVIAPAAILIGSGKLSNPDLSCCIPLSAPKTPELRSEAIQGTYKASIGSTIPVIELTN